MNVLIVSQCSKRALFETRRILDQFAERRGDRTWQTSITQQGLATLHKVLRKSARKNTAVACHWIRGKGHTELVWIVGRADRFNEQGAVPTNTTMRDILRSNDENDWHTAEEIRLLASLAALLHDLGKANEAFQEKIKEGKAVADAYRHEWISLRLFEAFVGKRSDEQWLSCLANLEENYEKDWIGNLLRDGLDSRLLSPFRKLPPLAKSVGWLMLSHHRMPTQEYKIPIRSADLERLPDVIEAQWCGERRDSKASEVEACWHFREALPFESKHWREHASKTAQALLDRPQMLSENWLDNSYVLNLSRLSLMLADHSYSGEPSHSHYGDPGFSLFANTDRESGLLKQRLDEHLIGVEVNAGRIVRTLPWLTNGLPRIARHKGFRQRSKDERFRWQDRAFRLAEGLRERSAKHGFFGVNMASTGCGKTLANGRIVYGLADTKKGARFVMALGLRTLTLQTGDVYRERLGLGAEDLAVLVGGGGIRTLHELEREKVSGSQSLEDLLPENQYVHYEGSLEDSPLDRWLRRNADAQKLLNAPVVACTIDHLMPATEGTRGGRQIAPMLRLMTSDLVLDEPDDLGTEDLPALTRLVHWTGLLGSRVLLSSATLPPSLVKGLFQAYLEGRRIFQRNRGIPGLPLNICCAWFDEFSVFSGDYTDDTGFEQAHADFADKRVKSLCALSKKEVRRKAEIKPLPVKHGLEREEICMELATHVHAHLHELHTDNHVVDPVSNKRVSFGLVRMANIGPLTETAQALYRLGAKKNCRIHLCVYHSQHPLLVRSGIERRLDRWLDRGEEGVLFKDEEFRKMLDAYGEEDQIFVVLATAVAEVGRDHDYDWAVVEPSSMRSIIQLAGRIRRHRPGSCKSPNMYLLDTNVRHLEYGSSKPAFCRPGFESEGFPLKTHLLSELLTPDQLSVIDSSARIRERTNFQPRQNLADLEHARLRALMLGEKAEGKTKVKPVHWWWSTRAALSGELQRKQPFRYDPQGSQRYCLKPDENDEIHFCRFEDDGHETPASNLRRDVALQKGPRIGFFGEPEYGGALEELAGKLDMESADCARRFGVVDLPAKGAEQGWHYHPALGFSPVR